VIGHTPFCPNISNSTWCGVICESRKELKNRSNYALERIAPFSQVATAWTMANCGSMVSSFPFLYICSSKPFQNRTPKDQPYLPQLPAHQISRRELGWGIAKHSMMVLQNMTEHRPAFRSPECNHPHVHIVEERCETCHHRSGQQLA